MADSFGTASTFSISEITGEKRRLDFTGRGLPHQPITFTGTQRAEFTWYPGNPEASVQVFGAEEQATTVRGEWKDRFIQESNSEHNGFTAGATLEDRQLGSAIDVARAVDDFRRKGQLVRVNWQFFGRVGIITKFTQTLKWGQDVEYEIEFTWISQGDTPSAALLDSQLDLGEILALVKEQVANLREKYDENPFDFRSQIPEALADYVADIEDLRDQMIDTVASVGSTASPADRIVGRLAGLYSSLTDSTTGLADELRSTTPLGKFSVPGTPSYGDLLSCELYEREFLDATRDIRRSAAIQLSSLSKQLEPNLLGTYFAKDGDNLRDVATAYYGVPGEWRSLLSYNSLDSSELTAGQLVLVPKLQSQFVET